MRLTITEGKRRPESINAFATAIFAHFRHNIENATKTLEPTGLIPKRRLVSRAVSRSGPR